MRKKVGGRIMTIVILWTSNNHVSRQLEMVPLVILVIAHIPCLHNLVIAHIPCLHNLVIAHIPYLHNV
jgi:hypothetical protein